MFHHRSLTASKTALTTSTAHLDSVIKYILSHMLFSQHILSQVFKGWKLLNRLDISKRILQPMRLNSNCCGVMDNGCFHHGLRMIICGKSGIFNVILTIALNTGKNCQKGGLFGPDCENENSLPMIKETWNTFQRGGFLRANSIYLISILSNSLTKVVVLTL